MKKKLPVLGFFNTIMDVSQRREPVFKWNKEVAQWWDHAIRSGSKSDGLTVDELVKTAFSRRDAKNAKEIFFDINNLTLRAPSGV